MSPLHDAACAGDAKAVRALLEAGAAVDEAGDCGQTALLDACEAGKEDVVMVLLEFGADPNDDGGGMGALQIAARNNYAAIVEALLSRGADVNFRCEYGSTALHSAAMMGHTSIVLDLLKAGADASIHTIEGDGALDFALQVWVFFAARGGLLAGGAPSLSCCFLRFTGLVAVLPKGST
jgi:ankyrin repeat protein